MNKLFGLFLLAASFLAPDLAQAANRFAVCSTTCTWDNTSTAMWSTSTGGATGASAPVAGDDVILDAATCVGGTTCTITTFAGTISANTITWGACTASTTGCIIAANTNNTNFTLSSSSGAPFNGNGSGTRKWTGGSGTYTLTLTNVFNPIFNMSSTNDQGSTFNSATWILSGTAGAGGPRGFTGGGFSFGPTTFNANASGGAINIGGANTFASMVINGPMIVRFPAGTTTTISGSLTLTGTSNSAVASIGSTTNDSVATISLGSASTGTWASLYAITFSGAATMVATNCFSLGIVNLNGGSCATPGGGGGGGGRIIGG